MSCSTPLQLKETGVTVSCGKCSKCKKNRVNGWAFRLQKESIMYTSAAFLTLTYDTTKVHITPKGLMTLNVRDHQLYMKRLRMMHTRKYGHCPLIRYYTCGEYGSKNRRPHFHQILFGADIELVQPSWQNGSVHYGTVSGASIMYTLKYMMKPPVHHWEGDDRVLEFQLMSARLGKNYLTPEMVTWHRNDMDKRQYIPLEDGKKIAMPRYYKDKIYTPEEQALINVAHAKRASEEMVKYQTEMMAKFGDEWEHVKQQREIADRKRMYKNAHEGRHI